MRAQDTLSFCIGDTPNFGVPSTTGSIYNWTVQNSSVAAIVSGNGTEYITLEFNNIGIFRLLVEEIDVNGCNGYDSIVVQIHPLPEPVITSTAISFCEGDSILLEVDSLYDQLLWSNGMISPYIYASTTDDYFITVTDINDCSNTSNSISVNSYENPDVDFIYNGLCVGSPTLFVNQSLIPSTIQYSSIWHLSNGEIKYGDTIYYTYNQAGDHNVSLSIQTDVGCVDSLIKTVSIFNKPKAEFTYSPATISTLNPNVSFLNTSQYAEPFLWIFGDSTTSSEINPLHTYDNPGVYNVTLVVEDTNQCRGSVVNNIYMYYDFILHVPTAFTPNNDGENDTFYPKGLRMNKYISYDFCVYNRWGDRVFQTNNIDEQWDGIGVSSDVYNWTLVIIDELGEVRKEYGSVNLIK